MKRFVALVSCLACMSVAGDVAAQGPVRRALRGAGEATADAARVTAQGARAGLEVAGDAARTTARGVVAGVDAVTPDVPLEARAGGVVDRDARWRRVHHNGEWWYYTPENSWMVYQNNTWAPYNADTYVPSQPHYQGSAAHGAQQMVFIDSGGRAVMCQSGRIVFLDGTELRSVDRSQVNAQGYFIEQGQVQTQGQAGLSTQTGYRGTTLPGEAGVDASVNQGAGATIQGGAQATPNQGAGAAVDGSVQASEAGVQAGASATAPAAETGAEASVLQQDTTVDAAADAEAGIDATTPPATETEQQ